MLDAAQRLRVAVLRFKDDQRVQLFDQTALTRDAEFGGKQAVHPGNHLDLKAF